MGLALFGRDPEVHKLCWFRSLWPAEGARPKAMKGWELVQLVAGREDAAGTSLPPNQPDGGAEPGAAGVTTMRCPFTNSPVQAPQRLCSVGLGGPGSMSQGRRITVRDLLALPLNSWRALSSFVSILQRRS